MVRRRHIIILMALLLMAGGATEAWAFKVTYHILTLPLDHEKGTANTKLSYDGWRMEAVRVVFSDASTVELPAHFKSPLAKNFTFYPESVIKKDGTAHDIYQNNSKFKYFLYKAPLAPYVKVTVSEHAITNEVISNESAWSAAASSNKKTATSYANMESQVGSLADGDYYFSFQDVCLAEGDGGAEIPSNDYHIYVTYEYDADNTIAKLDGSESYNITLGDGFLAFNRGRNNRPAVIPKQYVSAEQLASDEFVYVDVSKVKNSSITAYWEDKSGKNKNRREDVESQFHFKYLYEGEDPYNITIRSAYNNEDTYYIEQDTYDADYVRKYYKGAVLFGNSVGAKIYFASDDDVKYTTVYNSVEAEADATLVSSESKPGYYRSYGTVYNSFALLSSKALDGSKDGYVFMGTRIFNANGSYKDPGTGKYYYLRSDHNDPYYQAMTPATAVTSHSTDKQMYAITTVNFKVPTPFYNPSGTDEEKAAHTLTASIDMSEYTFSTADISDADIPVSLKRKYCNINGYYKDAARTQAITKYSDLGEGRDIYLGYEVLPSIPFRTITPAASYSSATWNAATWYELTDAESSQVDGKKLKYDGSTNFKNNGADGDYVKASEFAFIGDPYELRVISRSQTSGASPSYVGVASNTPSSGTAFTASSTAYSGNVWEVSDDATAGSFLLRKYKGEGYWNWTTDHLSQDISYSTASHTYNVPNSNAHTITFNITNLTYADGNYIKVTAGGTNADQVTATSPVLSTGTQTVSSDGKATVTVSIKARGASNKTFTITITEYNSSDAVVGTASVITINQNVSTAYAGNAVEYSTSSSTRIKVMELPTRTFTYKIVDLAGNVAATASVSQSIFTPLSLATIPSIIVSPFLVGETLTFYSSFNNGSGPGTGTSRTHLTSTITETSNSNHDIYVKYTTSHLREKPIQLSEDQTFFVKLNGQYLYYDAGVIKSSATSTDADAYKWLLRARDPYAMLIDNLAARTANSVSGREDVTVYDDDGTDSSVKRDMGAWVQVDDGTWGNDKSLEFTTTRADASRFIAKSSGAMGSSIYEVMAADGSVDASTTYYNIGRSAVDVVKIYSNATYAHGAEVLKFELEANAKIVYHLIDKSKNDLIQVDSRSPDLSFPNEYKSPLVATYHYWKASAFVDADPDGGVDFSFTGSPSELTSVGELTDAKYNSPVTIDASAYSAAAEGFRKTATTEENMITQVKLLSTGTYYFLIGSDTYKSVTVTDGHKSNADIYVTYDTDERFGFGTKNPYMLKFLNGKNYKLEDGNDKLTTSKMQAMYPYCNGDGHLNIYGSESNEEQMNGGSSTRPRWVWFMESENHDPYHVKIHSRSTISFNGASNSTYLQTYAVHFNQETDAPNKQRIVTGGNLSGISQIAATEYMILGTTGHYRLLTTNPIAADTNGDGDTSDSGENERRYVTSFEQYWKTYNMLKQHVLGYTKSADEFSKDPATFVMPSELWATLKGKLGSGDGNFDINDADDLNYIDGCSWHSYEVAANALRWNGYDDKGKANTKKVEILEHWFQTFDMGDGTFDIESADIPPVLVLLDRHGWEIMRKQLPIGPDPEKTAALKAYDSPMVKEYQFYNNATKAGSCHKYYLRLQDGKLRDEIKVDGVPFTSTSLGTLPPMKADQFGTYPDIYVTYTVKDEYEKSYTYNYNESTGEETFTASKFLIVMNARYARNQVGDTEGFLSKPVFQGSYPTGGNVYDMILNPNQNEVGNVTVDDDDDGKIDNNNLWYVQPNLAIDDEMGIPWASTTGNENEPLTREETKKKYKDKTGFDPYNLQFKNVDTEQFLTMRLSSTELSNGGWEGTLSSNTMTLEDATTSGYVTPEGHDHTTLQITKQTFMAVSDANGNMQLMPRFDHTKRIQMNSKSEAPNYYTILAAPVNHSKAVVTNNASMGPQTTFFVRPQVFEYHIINNDGNEALRYKTAGEYTPSIPDKVKSPLATDFKYYYGNTTNSITTATADDWNSTAELYKRTALHADSVGHQARFLPATGDYYFRIGTVPASYTYKKVSVTEVKEITGLFAEAGLDEDENTVYVRYSYNESADMDGDNILHGKWVTMNLAGKDVQSSGTIDTSDGTGVTLYADDTESPTKPATVDEDDKKWQWKFLSSPSDISSPYYRPTDPYAVQIFNREANYSSDLSVEPNPMGIGIKVGGKDRFAILNHPDGGYALAVTGLGSYTYSFLNGASMTTPSSTGASIVEECYQRTVSNNTDYGTLKTTLAAGADGIYYIKINGTEASDVPQYKKVTISSNVATDEDVTQAVWEKAYISPGAKVVLNDEVDHTYEYRVITNDDSGNKLAISQTQDKDGAGLHHFVPYLPDNSQTPLLNTDDYIYYGSAAESTGSYTVVDATKLITLYGLYDDKVYVRYKAYNPDNTAYLVPNKKAVVDGKATKAPGSNDVAIDISGKLPYNIYWENDNMMKRGDTDAIIYDTGKDLSGDAHYIWLIEGNDPYALQIKHKASGNYVNGESTLNATAKNFMLLKKENYDYGILQETGGTNRLTGYGNSLTTGDPTKFIMFGLSTHKLIYHLVINSTLTPTSIPYREGTESSPSESLVTKDIPGTTQRDLISMSYGVPGDKYQLGSTIMGRTYSVNAGEVSLGDELAVPTEFDRPNCNFFYYIDNIQKHGATDPYQKTVATEAAMETDANALTSVGNYYYKITGGKIYRKVHVTSTSPSVVYEISGSTEAAYNAAATSTSFQRTAASVDAMKSDAASITILGDHYYKINGGTSYYRFTKYPVAVNGSADTTIVVCTETDWNRAVASKETSVADEAAMNTAANSLASVGDHYYEIGGTLTLYKKVQVTTAADGGTPAVYTVVDCDEDDWNNVWQDDAEMNNLYKGLKATKLMSDAGLIGGLVNVNVAYAFEKGLETNAGEGFVTSVDENLWYTFETLSGTTPFLAQYTNAWGLQAKEGRDTRYTNDYLWSPLGDVYGFRMYNRYMIKNSGGTANVMTMSSISEGQNLLLHLPDATYTVGYEVFELLPSNNLGYFRIHPVINNTGTRYYVRKDPSDNYAKLSTTSSEWTFNLTTELLNPYIERVGYVGGLTETAYTANKTVLDKVKNGTASYKEMLDVQGVVYDDANIVKYEPGYYRLHSQPGVSGISPVRYASGYLHDIEKGSGVATAIPMHFYSKTGVSTTFETLANGFTYSHATRGPIPVPATEADPSTIFYFAGSAVEAPANPTSTMQTQGLYVAVNSGEGLGTNREKRAVMSASSGDAMTLTLMDIGGAVLLIHDGDVPANRRYLNYDQSNFFQRTATDNSDYDTKKVALTSVGVYYFKIGSSTYKKVTVTALDPYAYAETDANSTSWERAADIYDLKYYHDSPTDDAKWCMEPANNQGLLLETHSGGDGHFYTTFYAPYDLKLPDDGDSKHYYAYICKEWNSQLLCPEKTGNGGKDIPANTPVIIRTDDTSEKVKLSFPESSLSSVAGNIFTGSYLEQLLATPITASNKVYTLGLPITGYGMITEAGENNGNITNYIDRSQAYTGIGFYVNATQNKELSEETGQWTPNNRYVIHNKIYYREVAAARRMDGDMPDFVPVIFEDEEEEGEEPNGNVTATDDNCVYDLQGRCVVSGKTVTNGTWRQGLSRGIYLLNGKKYVVR
ncbi:MAG: hypothetical protein IJ081_01230 [Prevotella sp.]|nr:hypothetical protein [Prevotella sp.]